MKSTFTFELTKEQVQHLELLCNFHLKESYNDYAKAMTRVLVAELHLDNWEKLFEDTEDTSK